MEINLSVIYAVGLAVLILPSLYFFFRCKHAWELVDKTQLPSKLEEMRKFWPPQTMSHGDLMTGAKVCATLVIRCPRCGACKIIRMSNEG